MEELVTYTAVDFGKGDLCVVWTINNDGIVEILTSNKELAIQEIKWQSFY